MKIKLTEKQLFNIIKESISKILKEEIENNDILYHQLPFDEYSLKSILTNGLIPRDNGEAFGIWFSKNQPFYGFNKKENVTLSVTYNNNFKENHSYTDDVTLVIVKDIVTPNEIKIVECPFMIDSNTNEPLLGVQNLSSLKTLSNKKGYQTIANYIVNNKHLNERNITIFSDIYEKYIEQNTLNILSKNKNITLKNIL